jgi:hypothetical protein
VTKVDLTQFNRQMSKALNALDDLPEFAETTMKAYTPIAAVRGGNARRNTRLRGNNTVVADYPYAERLEDNWSPQTKGQGIIAPTEAAIQREVDRRLKGI